MKENYMNTILQAPFRLPKDELQVHLAIRPGSKHEAIFKELIERVEQVGKPKAMFRISYVEKRGAEDITIEDIKFHSAAMRAN